MLLVWAHLENVDYTKLPLMGTIHCNERLWGSTLNIHWND